MKPVTLKSLLVCFIALAFGSGCVPLEAPSATVLPATDTFSVQTKPFLTPTANLRIPSPTVTTTSVPGLSPTLAPILTASSAPTLDSVASAKLIKEYLANNGNCALPCIWGLTPGQSTIQEAQHLMEYLNLQGYTQGDSYLAKAFTFDENRRFQGNLTFYERYRLVQEIQLYANDSKLAPYYELKNVMQQLGIPTYIDIFVTIGVPSDAPRPKLTAYDITILYSTSQVERLGDAKPWAAFSYGGAALKLGDIYRFCPTNLKLVGLVEHDEISGYGFPIGFNVKVQSTESPMTLDEMAQRDGFPRYSGGADLTLATKTSIQEFYAQVMKSNEPACFDTLIDFWP